MRRLLLSIGLSVAVGGAVLGAAATLSLNPTTLAAGSTVVASCDTGTVSVGWQPTALWGQPGFEVYVARFSDLDYACLGRSAKAVVTQDGVSLAQASFYNWWDNGLQGTGSSTLDAYFWDAPVPVGPVNDVHLVIE
jgi:hypothetical protein